MARRQRGEQQIITAADVATPKVGKDGAITVGIETGKCAICGEVYTPISADKTTWPKYRGKPFRQPNDWTPDSVLNHRLSHLSAKARRVVGKYVKQPKSVQEEISALIAELG